MEGLVLSDEEAGREKLFGFDEAMEVNSNTDFLHWALNRRFNLPIVIVLRSAYEWHDFYCIFMTANDISDNMEAPESTWLFQSKISYHERL